MKTPFVLGLLVRSLLLVSVSSLVACSSVLRASRVAQLPAGIMANAPTESSHEKVLPVYDASPLNIEAHYGSLVRTGSGYQWVLGLKDDARNSPAMGYWVIKPSH